MRDLPAARLINVGRARYTRYSFHPRGCPYCRERDLFGEPGGGPGSANQVPNRRTVLFFFLGEFDGRCFFARLARLSGGTAMAAQHDSAGRPAI